MVCWGMTVQQSLLIRKSFALVEEHRHIDALVFYRRLFTLAPELRPLFRTDIEKQAAKLTDMLSLLIAKLDRPASLEAELLELGARHVAYGVKDEHYEVVGRALLDMLAEVCGAAFTPEVRAAWTALYDSVQSAMRRGAASKLAAV